MKNVRSTTSSGTCMVKVEVLNATFNNISATIGISWQSVLLVEETRGRVPGENQRPTTSH